MNYCIGNYVRNKTKDRYEKIFAIDEKRINNCDDEYEPILIMDDYDYIFSL